MLSFSCCKYTVFRNKKAIFNPICKIFYIILNAEIRLNKAKQSGIHVISGIHSVRNHRIQAADFSPVQNKSLIKTALQIASLHLCTFAGLAIIRIIIAVREQVYFFGMSGAPSPTAVFSNHCRGHSRISRGISSNHDGRFVNRPCYTDIIIVCHSKQSEESLPAVFEILRRSSSE